MVIHRLRAAYAWRHAESVMGCLHLDSILSLSLHVAEGEGSVSKPFKSDNCIYKHERIYNVEKISEYIQNASDFVCHRHLQTEDRTHTGEKPYKCKDCGKAFAKRSGLITHISTHASEKPFACKECGKAFASSPRLSQHIRIHSGERPYVCEQCGKGFIQLKYLLMSSLEHSVTKSLG